MECRCPPEGERREDPAPGPWRDPSPQHPSQPSGPQAGRGKCLLFWALSLRPPQAPGPVAEKRGAQGEFVTPREAHGRGPVAVTGRGAQGAAGKGR